MHTISSLRLPTLIVLLVNSLLISSPISATESPTSETGTSPSTEEEFDIAPPLETNLTERAEKEYSANMEIIGTHGAGALSAGFNVGYFVTPTMILEFAHTWGYFRDREKELRVSLERSGRSTLTEFRIKHYLGDALYINAGLGLWRIKGSLRAHIDSDTVGDTTISDPNPLIYNIRDSRKLGFTFGVGNNWQWENLQIGCDWLGTFVPVMNVKEDIDDNPLPGWMRTHFPDKADDAAEAATELKEATKYRTSSMLRFYVGWAF